MSLKRSINGGTPRTFSDIIVDGSFNLREAPLHVTSRSCKDEDTTNTTVKTVKPSFTIYTFEQVFQPHTRNKRPKSTGICALELLPHPPDASRTAGRTGRRHINRFLRGRLPNPADVGRHSPGCCKSEKPVWFAGNGFEGASEEITGIIKGSYESRRLHIHPAFFLSLLFFFFWLRL